MKNAKEKEPPGEDGSRKEVSEDNTEPQPVKHSWREFYDIHPEATTRTGR
jgi:hypothetical protein